MSLSFHLLFNILFNFFYTGISNWEDFYYVSFTKNVPPVALKLSISSLSFSCRQS